MSKEEQVKSEIEQKQLKDIQNLQNEIRVKDALAEQYKNLLNQSLEYTSRLEIEIKAYQAILKNMEDSTGSENK